MRIAAGALTTIAGMARSGTGDTAVVIPAKNEAERITATVTAARRIPGVDVVLVVDDGSTDGTSREAEAAGAIVVRHSRNRGKAAAMETGATTVAALDSSEDRAAPRLLLFLDADLGASADGAEPLIAPVRAGEVDMTIGVLPTKQQEGSGGGHGFVVKLARDGIRGAVGFEATQPLSGQRCLRREVFQAVLPLAHGFGVETGLTIDVLRAGYRVREVPVELHHRVTGTDLRAQLHRGRQYRDVLLALTARKVPRPVRDLFGPGRP
jgi:glycosyltransferase involved in cell wall biosynthesis